MNISDILLDGSGTLRSGWRFAVFVGAFVVIGIVMSAAAAGVLSAFGISMNEPSAASLIAGSAAALVASLAAGWFAGRSFEQLPFRALGAWFTKGWLINLLLGLMLGTGAVTVAVLIAAAFGGLRFELNTSHDTNAILATLAVSFAIFAVAAAFEEALLRGYILQTFLRSGHYAFGIVFTSSIFGILHLTNPSAGIISTANTILAGFWFCAAYLKTRDLWLAWAAHLMWNWTQGSIFGIEVSGLREIAPAPLLTEIDRGPVWLTGQNYGIEGGIACTVALVAAIVITWKMPFARPAEEMLAFTKPVGEAAIKPSVS